MQNSRGATSATIMGSLDQYNTSHQDLIIALNDHTTPPVEIFLVKTRITSIGGSTNPTFHRV